MSINKYLLDLAKQKQKDSSHTAQAQETQYIKILLTEPQLKFIITLVENIANLQKSGLLELSSNEIMAAESFYETLIESSRKYLEVEKTSYEDQLNTLRRLNKDGSNRNREPLKR